MGGPRGWSRDAAGTNAFAMRACTLSPPAHRGAAAVSSLASRGRMPAPAAPGAAAPRRRRAVRASSARPARCCALPLRAPPRLWPAVASHLRFHPAPPAGVAGASFRSIARPLHSPRARPAFSLYVVSVCLAALAWARGKPSSLLCSSAVLPPGCRRGSGAHRAAGARRCVARRAPSPRRARSRVRHAARPPAFCPGPAWPPSPPRPRARAAPIHTVVTPLDSRGALAAAPSVLRRDGIERGAVFP
jgi:hypothetical protein